MFDDEFDGTEQQKPLSPELQEILDEAQSRGSLIDGHPDLKPIDPEAKPPVVVPRFHNPGAPKGKDPRTMGPQPTPVRSGYGNGSPAGTVDDPDWRKKFFGGQQ